ncbi:hypothetical protein Peur_023238 [Populus x canadensis]
MAQAMTSKLAITKRAFGYSTFNSNNIFSGFIPSSIGNLAKLEALDLSRNKLSGNIPKQLVQLTFLQFFIASHNHLTGPIPRGNQFNTFQKDSFDAIQD